MLCIGYRVLINVKQWQKVSFVNNVDLIQNIFV